MSIFEDKVRSIFQDDPDYPVLVTTAPCFQHNFMYMNYGLVCQKRTETEMKATLDTLVGLNIDALFFNLSYLKKDGRLAFFDDIYCRNSKFCSYGAQIEWSTKKKEALKAWTSYIRTYNDETKKKGIKRPHIVSVGMIGGCITMGGCGEVWHLYHTHADRHVVLNDTSVYNNIVDTCDDLVDEYGLDGINLDLEPTKDTDITLDYRNLIRDVRKKIGWNKHLSVACGTLHWTKNWIGENNYYIKDVSTRVDMLAIMCYDQGFNNATKYKQRIADAIKHYQDNNSGRCAIYVVMPAYALDPSIGHYSDETIKNAADGVMDFMAKSNYFVDGAGVWVWDDGTPSGFKSQANINAWKNNWLKHCK